MVKVANSLKTTQNQLRGDTSKEFTASFYKKFEGRVYEFDRITVNYNQLLEVEGGSGVKPPNCFRYRGGTYLYDSECIQDYDKFGRPILKYFYDNLYPAIKGKVPTPLKPEPRSAYVCQKCGAPVTKEQNICAYCHSNLKPVQVDYTLKEPLVQDDEGLGFSLINAHEFDKTFNRGEMVSVIKSSQKENTKWDWMTLLIGVMMGSGLGLIIGIILYPHLFAQPVKIVTVTTTTATTATTQMIDFLRGVFLKIV